MMKAASLKFLSSTVFSFFVSSLIDTASILKSGELKKNHDLLVLLKTVWLLD